MSRYRFLSALVTCFVFSCVGPENLKQLPKTVEQSIKQPPKNTWQLIKWLLELPDDCFNNVKEDKDKLIKMLPQTEEEFKDKNFASKRHEIYRKALKLYGAIAYNLQEENKQLQAKCDQLQAKCDQLQAKCDQLQAKCDQNSEENKKRKEQVRSLLEKQKNSYQENLNKKDEMIKKLQEEIQTLKKPF